MTYQLQNRTDVQVSATAKDMILQTEVNCLKSFIYFHTLETLNFIINKIRIRW